MIPGRREGERGGGEERGRERKREGEREKERERKGRGEKGGGISNLIRGVPSRPVDYYTA